MTRYFEPMVIKREGSGFYPAVKQVLPLPSDPDSEVGRVIQSDQYMESEMIAEQYAEEWAGIGNLTESDMGDGAK